MDEKGFWKPKLLLGAYSSSAAAQERKPDEFLIKFQKSWNAFAKYGKRESIPPLHSHMNAKRIHNLLHKSLTLWKYVHKTAYFSQSLWQPQAGIWRLTNISEGWSLKAKFDSSIFEKCPFKMPILMLKLYSKNFPIKLKILFAKSTIHSEEEVEKLSTTACLLPFVPLQLYAQWDINRSKPPQNIFTKKGVWIWQNELYLLFPHKR